MQVFPLLRRYSEDVNRIELFNVLEQVCVVNGMCS